MLVALLVARGLLVALLVGVGPASCPASCHASCKIQPAKAKRMVIAKAV